MSARVRVCALLCVCVSVSICVLTLSIPKTGQLYVWGSNKSGQLGLPCSIPYRRTPARVGGLLCAQHLVNYFPICIHSAHDPTT